MDCSSSSSGCNGGQIEGSLRYFKYHETITRDKYPYKEGQFKCMEDQLETSGVSVQAIGESERGNQLQIKQAIAASPVVALVVGNCMEFQMYSSGVFDTDSCGTTVD